MSQLFVRTGIEFSSRQQVLAHIGEEMLAKGVVHETYPAALFSPADGGCPFSRCYRGSSDVYRGTLRKTDAGFYRLGHQYSDRQVFLRNKPESGQQ